MADEPMVEAGVSVVIPALNEEAPIAEVVWAVRRQGIDDVIVVDNGSTDATAERAREAGARVVSEPRRGYGRAVSRGVASVAPASTILIFLDGNGSDCPDFIPALLAPIVNGTHDFVIGSRIRGNRQPGSMTLPQRLAGRLAGVLLRLVYGVRFTDMGPLRAIRRDCLARLGMREQTYGWNVEMQMRAAKAKLRILEIPVDHRCRTGGNSKVSGTLAGTVKAAVRILLTIARIALSPR
jgi:glycosyltransferase involved in cell wall biosynthesis